MIRALSLFVLLATPLRADPVLSLAGTLPASGDYDAVLTAIEDIGATATSLTLYWDDLEKDGKYAADPDWPAIAQATYPDREIAVHLTLAVIDTVTDRRPEDLRALPWDDPLVAKRFEALVGEILTRMPDVTLQSVAVGNEVDGHLSGAAWEAYGRFFEAARSAIRDTHDVPVTITMTWPALRDRPEARSLAARSDGLSITYYPMDDGFRFAPPDVVSDDIAAMSAMAGGPWDLAEVGYASGGCGASSLVTQSAFFESLMQAASADENLRLMQLVWSHDISREEVAGYSQYYGVRTPCFADYLASLGLRTAEDLAKPAFDGLAAR